MKDFTPHYRDIDVAKVLAYPVFLGLSVVWIDADWSWWSWWANSVMAMVTMGITASGVRSMWADRKSQKALIEMETAEDAAREPGNRWPR